MTIRPANPNKFIDGDGAGYQDVKILVQRGVEELVGEASEVAGGPLESDGAGEHGPEGKQEDRREHPKLVLALPEQPTSAIYAAAAAALPLCRRRSSRSSSCS